MSIQFYLIKKILSYIPGTTGLNPIVGINTDEQIFFYNL